MSVSTPHAHRRTRDDFLDAAARAFSRKGFSATTVKDIAEEAGCTPAALYAHFDGKQAVFDAILDRIRQLLLATLEAPAPADLSLEQRLELLLMRQFQVAEQHREEMVIFFALGRQVPSSGAPLAHGAVDLGAEPPRGFDLYCVTLARWLGACPTPPGLDALGLDLASYLLGGLVSGIFRHWTATGARTALVPRAPLVARMFLRGLAADPDAEVPRV